MASTTAHKIAVAVAGAIAFGGLVIAPATAVDEGTVCKPLVGTDRVLAGTELYAGHPIASPSGRFTFGLSANGELALRNTETGARRWLKKGGAGATAAFDAGGALLLRSASGSVVWRSRTSTDCAQLVVQDSGRVAIVADGSLRWTVPAAAARWRVALPTAQGPAPTASPSPSPTPTKTPAASASPSPTPPASSPSASPSPTAEPSPSAAPKPSASPSPKPTAAAPAPTTPAPQPTTPAPAAPVPPPAPPAPPGTRVASLYPFSSSSPFNTAIGSGAQYQDPSDPVTASFLSATPVINSTRWSFPVFLADGSDRVATVRNTSDGKVYQLRIPDETAPTHGTDMHVGIIEADGVTAWEFYKMVRTGDLTWTTTRVTKTDLRGDGSGGSRASNISIYAGLIRTQEVADLSIKHTLALGLPNSALKDGWVWPALSQDRDGKDLYSGNVPMGTLAAIPPSVDINSLGLSAEGLALARALQDYGAYVLLRSDTAALFCEPGCDQGRVASMKADWYKLYPLMRVVANNAPGSVGGGGAPRVAPLEPLA